MRNANKWHEGKIKLKKWNETTNWFLLHKLRYHYNYSKKKKKWIFIIIIKLLLYYSYL